MEGNGPLYGSHRHPKSFSPTIQLQADFVCARLMGLNPSLAWHHNRASRFLGNDSAGCIDLVAERLPQQVVPFDVLPEFGHLEMHV